MREVPEPPRGNQVLAPGLRPEAPIRQALKGSGVLLSRTISQVPVNGRHETWVNNRIRLYEIRKYP